MKTTYLVFKEIDGVRQLIVASKEEWDAILKLNKTLPDEKRRHFILDCIEEEDGLDRMYIEVSQQEYREWHTGSKRKERNRKKAANCKHISLDVEINSTEVASIHECVADLSVHIDDTVVDLILIDELRASLRKWKPWGEEMLDMYLKGNKRSCTSEICRKYGLQERAARYRKEQFEMFVKKFLK